MDFIINRRLTEELERESSSAVSTAKLQMLEAFLLVTSVAEKKRGKQKGKGISKRG